jgi:hypothetical protein
MSVAAVIESSLNRKVAMYYASQGPNSFCQKFPILHETLVKSGLVGGHDDLERTLVGKFPAEERPRAEKAVSELCAACDPRHLAFYLRKLIIPLVRTTGTIEELEDITQRVKQHNAPEKGQITNPYAPVHEIILF